MQRLTRPAAIGILALFGWLLSSTAHANVTVTCLDCGERGDDRTINLLVLEPGATSITLEWMTNNNPSDAESQIRLYAGNPEFTDSVPDLGIVDFETAGDAWRYARPFDVDELGRGTFLTVLVRESGNRRQILDWTTHRLITRAEIERQREIRTSGGNWSVDITPALLQVSSGHGQLPRSTGGDERVWWPLWATEGNISDADLDGEDTGVAGIGVQVSTPWHARENWRDSIVEKLTGVEGHTTKFGALRWVEMPDQELRLGDERVIDVRHYYTIVTLHTNASVRAFSAKDVGRGGSKRYFSHETSANLKPPPDPRFWSSYSRRDHSADDSLLTLLREQNAAGSVPGLAEIQTVDGDGGSTVYRVGLVASVRPWHVSSDEPVDGFVAGFVGIDLVAARAGLGSVRIREEGDGSLICPLLRCDSSDQNLDLNEPPKGYAIAQPVASLDTISGKLPMSQGIPAMAQRDVPRLGDDARTRDPADIVRLTNLPTQTRFAMGANLRAGALIRKGGLFGGRVDNVVPINAYAQFVVKMTVAMVPNSNIVANQETILPAPEELDVVTVVPPPRGLFDWLSDFFALSGFVKFLIVGAIVLALIVLVPGLRRVISAMLNLVAAAIDRVSNTVRPRT